MIQKRIIILFLSLLTLSVSVSAQVPPELQARWDKESAPAKNRLLEHRPSALPDRIILIPQSSNSQELAVVWRSDSSVTNGLVEIIEADSLNFPKTQRKRIESSYKTVQYKDYPMHFHQALIRDLKPGSLYKYRVGRSPQWSPWYSYRHPDYRDTIRLLYFGDTQNGIFNHATRIYKDALRKFGQANLALHIGDLINHANNDYEWAEWHHATGDINTSMPVMATPGNHEYLKNLQGKKVELSKYWAAQFPYPYTWDGGPFYLDYGFVRFVLLNSNEKLDQQGKWLDQILSETKQRWVVLVWHHPVFSGSLKRTNKGLLENWLPVIRKHRDKVALVLQGHDHTYARGGLDDRTGSLDRPSKPVFTVSVIGDKYYELNKQSWMDVAYPNTSAYQYIEFTREKISYRAFSETDVLIDHFEITK